MTDAQTQALEAVQKLLGEHFDSAIVACTYDDTTDSDAVNPAPIPTPGMKREDFVETITVTLPPIVIMVPKDACTPTDSLSK